MDPKCLKGKNIFITVAAQGMGATIVEYYVAHDANVCLGDVNVVGVEEVTARVNSLSNGKVLKYLNGFSVIIHQN